MLTVTLIRHYAPPQVPVAVVRCDQRPDREFIDRQPSTLNAAVAERANALEAYSQKARVLAAEHTNPGQQT
jgi:hypothetical protein